MSKFAIMCVLFAMAAAASASPPLFPPADGGHLLLVTSMRHLTRSADPLSLQRPDGRLEISNGCGYDTAIVEVRKQLVGHYKLNLIAAHLDLGEFCASMLQPEVKDYFLALAWNGTAWEVDPQLSSRLLPDEQANLWIVEPALVAQIEQAGGPKAKSVRFNRNMLEEIALGNEIRRSATPSPYETQVTIGELEKLRPVRGEWPDNPLYFEKGIALPEVETWLSANNSFKGMPLRGTP